MAREFDVIFDSTRETEKDFFQIASGYISKTTVLFEKEKVVAVIDAKGVVEFYDLDDNLLATACVPKVTGGKEKYMDAAVKAAGDKLFVIFPLYEWIDNYPNCDGESDRWDARIIGKTAVIFNKETNTATAEN